MTKLIAIEEHFLTPEIRAAWADSELGQEGMEALDRGEVEARLDDLGEGRLALMDEGGVDVQVLSVTTPALHNLDAEVSIPLASRTNDLIRATIAEHPDRYEGFATLPMAAPEASATELERAVRDLGLAGAMICGRTRETNFDHPQFEPLHAKAAELRAPIFIHPQVPQRGVREALYSGLGQELDIALSAFGLGWHYEAGIQFVRLMVAGVFDRYPDLQIVLGHWGEIVLFYLERMGSLGKIAGLERPVHEYFENNLYITASGMWSPTYLQRALEIVGPERLLFSTDYPYQYRPGRDARGFFYSAPLTSEQKELFGHGNWERLKGGIRRGV